MSVRLTEDHQMLVDAVREFARTELLERDREWDRDESSCCTEIGTLYKMGIMGLRVPESAGGLEVPMVPYARIIRELAYASPSVAVTVGVHSMVAQIIEHYAREDVKAEVLPKFTEVGNLSAFAISEPNVGSDPSSVATRAEKVADGYRLTGSKMWVTNGISGKWFVVLARLTQSAKSRTSRDGRTAGLCMFLMDADSEGVTRSAIHGKLGIRASETAEMSLDNVFIPQERLIGEEGWGVRIGLSALDGGRIGIASQALGIAIASLDLMVGYSKQREQFGQPISSYQAIQWMLADSKTEILASQQLIDKAAWLKDQGRPFAQNAAMAKLYASEAANRIADRAVQVLGGYGYVHEFRAEQLYRDARITRIYEGTSEIQRIVISRALLRES